MMATDNIVVRHQTSSMKAVKSISQINTYTESNKKRQNGRRLMVLETEILVIGGGPAGLAAAIAARKKGFEVMVADGARPPSDKACGEGLMPNTLAAIRELGIEIHPWEGKIFRRSISRGIHECRGKFSRSVRR